MPLTNAQYDNIMRDYADRRLRHEKEFRGRLQSAEMKYPRLRELDDEIASLSMKKARIKLGISADPDFDLQKEIQTRTEEKAALLEMAGFPEGIARPAFDCPLCRDTGFVKDEKCACFKQAEVALLYSQSHLGSIMQLENFDTFSLDWYSEQQKNDSNGLSARETAKRAAAYAKQFTEQFPKADNLLISGNTGVGKTFLSHCIAKALLDKGFSVLYLTDAGLLQTLRDNAFHDASPETQETARLVYECDLLLIDDFGATAVNSFTTSLLFECINERILNQKSTVISTNLSSSDLRDIYSERIYSRILSSYQRLYLFGEDIRILKKLRKGVPDVSEH